MTTEARQPLLIGVAGESMPQSVERQTERALREREPFQQALGRRHPARARDLLEQQLSRPDATAHAPLSRALGVCAQPTLRRATT